MLFGPPPAPYASNRMRAGWLVLLVPLAYTLWIPSPLPRLEPAYLLLDHDRIHSQIHADAVQGPLGVPHCGQHPLPFTVFPLAVPPSPNLPPRVMCYKDAGHRARQAPCPAATAKAILAPTRPLHCPPRLFHAADFRVPPRSLLPCSPFTTASCTPRGPAA